MMCSFRCRGQHVHDYSMCDIWTSTNCLEAMYCVLHLIISQGMFKTIVFSFEIVVNSVQRPASDAMLRSHSK